MYHRHTSDSRLTLYNMTNARGANKEAAARRGEYKSDPNDRTDVEMQPNHNMHAREANAARRARKALSSRRAQLST